MTTVAVLSLLATSVWAQADRRAGWDLPQVGDMLPEVEVYDEEGNPFSTAELKGAYTVLVFGCLT